MTVDFSKVRLIPIASVLSHYKVEVRKRNNTELVAQCPFPSHTSKKHEWTLAISTEKNKWYCHSETCRAASNKPKGGDSIDACALIENLTTLDAAKKLAEMFTLAGSGVVPAAPTTMCNKPLAFELKHLDPDHPLIRERGLSLDTIMDFGVGFQEGKGSMSNRICFPLYENGALIGYAGRATDGSEPRWKMPNGLVKSFLYGLERCDPAKPLYLVEGFWAVLWLHQNKLQAAALMGKSMNDQQEALLAPYADIRIALDNDAAGREAADKIAERLKAKHRVTKAFLKG